MTELNDPAIMQLLEASSQKETLMAVIIGVVSTIWIVGKVLPLVQWLKGDKKMVDSDENDWKSAVRIVNQKDIDGNSVFLGLPRMIREFTSVMQGFTGEMRNVFTEMKNLGNHQSETLRRMDKNQHETLRILTKLNTSTERFQKDFREQKN